MEQCVYCNQFLKMRECTRLHQRGSLLHHSTRGWWRYGNSGSIGLLPIVHHAAPATTSAPTAVLVRSRLEACRLIVKPTSAASTIRVHAASASAATAIVHVSTAAIPTAHPLVTTSWHAPSSSPSRTSSALRLLLLVPCPTSATGLRWTLLVVRVRVMMRWNWRLRLAFAYGNCLLSWLLCGLNLFRLLWANYVRFLVASVAAKLVQARDTINLDISEYKYSSCHFFGSNSKRGYTVT